MDELKNQGHRPIGHLLIESNAIIPQDLEFALDHQQYSHELLGQILLRMGAVNEEDLKSALTEQSCGSTVAV